MACVPYQNSRSKPSLTKRAYFVCSFDKVDVGGGAVLGIKFAETSMLPQWTMITGYCVHRAETGQTPDDFGPFVDTL